MAGNISRIACLSNKFYSKELSQILKVKSRLVSQGLVVTSNSSSRYLHSTPDRSALAKTAFSLYNDEHEEMKKTVRKLIDRDINPYVDKWEEEEMFPAHEVFKKFGEAGLLGITRSPEYGGLGLDYSYTLAFMEELGYANAGGVPMGIAVHTDCSTPALANFGSDELKKKFLAPSIAGDVVSCLGISEVGSGSDVASIKTTAKRVGDDLVINGGKMWTTNGCQADWMALLANTNQGPPHKNKSLICMPMNLPGIKISKKIKKIGNLCSDTAQSFFEDVRVPAKYIIGEEGMGFTYQMLQFQEERLAMCAISLTGFERAIEITIDYLKDRHAFGQPLIYNQSIHYKLAEMKTEVEALRALIYRAAAGVIEGENVTLLVTMAKVKAGKLSREIPDTCLQFWGGMGYTSESPINRIYRDSRLVSIGGGADEVMLSVICKFMGTLPPQPKKIIEKDINPFVDQWEEAEIYPAKEIFKKLGDAGLLGISKPTEYGGLGLDYTYTLAFLEELGWINCNGVPMSIFVHTECSTPALANFGSDELKRQFLVPSIAGDVVSCLGVSEVTGGSDVASITTNAKRVGDDLVINGGKMWITNGCQADWMCLLANTSQGPPHRNKSLICLPMNTPGITIAKKIKKMGNLCSDTAQIFFEDVRVPAKNIIGEEGKGFTYQMMQFQSERLGACPQLCVTLDRAIQETVNYLTERKAFGKPLIHNQSIHYKLAELKSEVECLRALVYSAANKMKDGEDVTFMASMAKLKAGKLSRVVSDVCLQFWGGMGYSQESFINRVYRDLRLTSIGGGADEVMMSIICKYMNILPPLKKK